MKKIIIGTISLLAFGFLLFELKSEFLDSLEERDASGFVRYELIDLANDTVIQKGEIKVEKSFRKEKNLLFKLFIGYIENRQFNIGNEFFIGHSRY